VTISIVGPALVAAPWHADWRNSKRECSGINTGRFNTTVQNEARTLPRLAFPLPIVHTSAADRVLRDFLFAGSLTAGTITTGHFARINTPWVVLPTSKSYRAV
jgi:hypothetical protein